MSDLMTHTFQVIEHRYDHKAPVTGLSKEECDAKVSELLAVLR